VVDEGRVSRLLRGITERTERLRAAAGADAEQRGDLWLDAVKYLFVTAIEGCVDVAQHVAASERWRAPDSNGDAIRLLAEHDVVTPEAAAAVAAAVGFRNVLVHRYIDVDDALVVAALDQLADFDAFVAQVSHWLLASGG
jgi:uncharacterized protein YutE (UPF0331/DUF86 family)